MKKFVLVMLLAFVGVNLMAQSSNNVLNTMYDSYFALKDALVKDDGKAAQVAADALSKNIADVQMDKLGNSHMVWMDNQKQLATNTGIIKNTDNVSKQRDAFVALSASMYVILKAIKPGYSVYWQHCPMYNQKKGGADWMSLNKEIKNPYFGSKMLTCGSTTEVIE